MTHTNVNELIKSIETNEIGGSIFSREDVIRILGMVEVQEQTPLIDAETLIGELNELMEEINNLEIDEDSLEFSINYSKQVELDSYEIEKHDAIELVKNIIERLKGEDSITSQSGLNEIE